MAMASSLFRPSPLPRLFPSNPFLSSIASPSPRLLSLRFSSSSSSPDRPHPTDDIDADAQRLIADPVPPPPPPSRFLLRDLSSPPRICTLREFGEGMVAVDSDSDTEVSNFFQTLAANIELSAKVQDWEILSGRLAMIVFALAVVAEAVTGNSVFEKMDAQRLLQICVAIVASSLVAAGFAIALEAKTRVAYSISEGYENLMNALIDAVFDNLLFDNEE